MGGYVESTKKAEISMRLSEFEMPPIQDVLIIGNKAPIGPEAVRRMVEVISPNQYEIIKIEHEYIEAVVVKKSLINMLPAEKLISIILEEGGNIANASMIIKVQINITFHVSKSIEL